ncbi:MAG TPA: hypothetical protein VGD31_00115, partial [Sphingobacteriaceae bacterium]
CQATSSVMPVTVNPLPAVPAITASPSNATVCAGGEVTLSAPGGYSYYWNTGETSQSINISASGSDFVTITNGNGCQATSSAIPVTINPLPAAPVITASPSNATVCSGGTVTLTAPAGYSYYWNTGATSQSINVSASGSYFVVITNGNGCQATSSAIPVTVSPLPDTPVITASPSNATVCAGGTVTLSAPGGYSYYWNTGETTQSINVSSSGSYYVVITNGNGCQAISSAIPVTVNSLPVTPVITANPSNATVCAGGTVTLSAPVGYSYYWNTGETSQSIIVSTSGSYYVVITNGYGCQATSSVIPVTINPLPATPVITASPSNAAVCAGGTVTLTAPSGYSYYWNTGATTQSINVSASGSYYVVVTNASGCQATSSAIPVTVNPLPTVPVITTSPSNATVCAGSTVTLSAPAGYSYFWNTGETSQSINVSSSGSYNVVITNENGCQVTSSAVPVTVNPLPMEPELPILSVSQITCGAATGTITITGPSAVAGTTLQYSLNDGESWQSSNVFSNVLPGNYSTRVRAINSGSGCISGVSGATMATMNTAPAVPSTPEGPAVSISQINCGATTGTITVTGPSAVAGTVLEYSLNDGASWQGSNMFSNVAPGGYYVRIRAVNIESGCYSALSAATFASLSDIPTVPSTPGVPSVSVSQISCGAATGTITVTGPIAVAGTMLEYSSNDGVNWQGSNAFSNVPPGSYSIRIRAINNSSGCYSQVSEPMSVTINPVPEVPQAPAYSIVHPDCDTATGAVTITAPTGAGYTYSMDGISFNSTGTFSGLLPGNYSLYAKSAYGCVSVAAEFVVNSQPPAPPAPVVSASGPTTFCSGATVTLSAPEGYTYLWNSGQASREIAITTGGNYSVTIFNESGCSATSVPILVTVLTVPEKPVIAASGPTAFCEGGSVTLTAPTATAYLWSNGATSKSITVSSSGTYAVTVINTNGCSSVSDSIQVLKMLIAVNGQRMFCQGESVTLYASNDFTSYQWYRNGNAIAAPAGTNISVNASETGVYTVQGSVSGGSCVSLPFQLSSFASPQISISSTASEIDSISYENCGPARFTVNVTDPDNSGQPVAALFKVEYDDGSTADIAGTAITLSRSADIEIQAISAAGCVTTRTASFVMNDNIPLPAVTASGPTSFCQGESVTLTAPGGYTYLWSNGSTGQSITINAAGEYKVKVTNADGCFSFSNPVSVMVNPLNSSN